MAAGAAARHDYPQRLLRSSRHRFLPQASLTIDACCDTFSRMPMPTRLMSNDDPPALTNGSGMPFVGINPSDDAEVDERLDRDHAGQAEGQKRTEAIGRAGGHLHARAT